MIEKLFLLLIGSFILYRIFKKLFNKYMFLVIFILLISYILISYIFISSFLKEEISRTHIKELISSNSNNIELKINGIQIINNDSIISDIKSIHKMAYHHSHPINKIKVEIISNKKKLDFYIGQDSFNNDEFWVRLNKSDLEDIGRFESKRLSKLLNKLN